MHPMPTSLKAVFALGGDQGVVGDPQGGRGQYKWVFGGGGSWASICNRSQKGKLSPVVGWGWAEAELGGGDAQEVPQAEGNLFRGEGPSWG